MPAIFGTNYRRDDLLRKTGNVSQLGGTRLVELQEGPERGVRAIDFDTGTGFRFTVLPDRGMDVFSASWRGRSLCWHSPAGVAAPAFYEPQGLGWLRTFPGGLVVTCGLTQAGTPGVDGTEELGLHGRASCIPARNVSHGTRWEGDECALFAQGTVVEASIFRPQITLTRTVTARLGEHRLFIHDEVENIGYAPCPHMIVYHCNIGFPVLDDGSRLISPTESVRPLNAEAQADADYARFGGPERGYGERVYDHTLKPGPDGMVRVALVNEAFDGGRGIGVYLRYSHEQLPRFTEWKMLGEGTYVVGMEPGNSSVTGRLAARDKGELAVLEPHERRVYDLEIGLERGA